MSSTFICIQLKYLLIDEDNKLGGGVDYAVLYYHHKGIKKEIYKTWGGGLKSMKPYFQREFFFNLIVCENVECLMRAEDILIKIKRKAPNSLLFILHWSF